MSTNKDKVVAALIKGSTQGGATVDGEGRAVGTGLAVAVSKRFELRLHMDAPGFRLKLGKWVDDVKHIVDSREGYRYGIWHDTESGLFHLDVSEVLLTHQLDLAIKRAKERGQIAMYHISTGTELRIK